MEEQQSTKVEDEEEAATSSGTESVGDTGGDGGAATGGAAAGGRGSRTSARRHVKQSSALPLGRAGSQDSGFVRPDRRGASCLQCRAAKVRCDRSLPSCSRCVRKGEKCEHGPTELANASWEGQGGDGPAGGDLPLGLSVFRQVVPDPPALFTEYAALVSAAVRDLQAKGELDRTRAINTLRVWVLENEAHDGFDMSWGALATIMSTLDLSRADLLGRAGDEGKMAEEGKEAGKEGQDAFEFPTLGGLPRARLSPAWETLDLSHTTTCKSLDPSVPTIIGLLDAPKLLWANQAALKVTHTPEEINAALEKEMCLGLFFTVLYVAPSDREDLLRACVRHLFGPETATSAMMMVLNKEGKAFLRFLRLRHTAFPQCGVVCTVLTLDEAPPSRYMIARPKSRDRIIEGFRSHPSGGPAGETSVGGLTEHALLPMTTMGQSIDPVRAYDMLSTESHSDKPFSSFLRLSLRGGSDGQEDQQEGGGGGGSGLKTSPISRECSEGTKIRGANKRTRRRQVKRRSGSEDEQGADEGEGGERREEAGDEENDDGDDDDVEEERASDHEQGSGSDSVEHSAGGCDSEEDC